VWICVLLVRLSQGNSFGVIPEAVTLSSPVIDAGASPRQYPTRLTTNLHHHHHRKHQIPNTTTTSSTLLRC
jgi:hypothetical protein